ncbi:MAG: DUF4062 domain-containing protein [Planctomycetota bacterium]
MNPPIFVSATSSDLGDARDLVVSVLGGMGYQSRVQPTFPFVGGDLRAELRRLIDECGMVIQLVGFRCGQVPTTDDPTFGRVSHTQYEALYAEQQGKRVLYITLPDTFPFTPYEPESEDKIALQRNYRDSLRARGDQRGTPANPDALRALILQLRDDLAEQIKLAAQRHAELRQDLREGFGDLKAVIAALQSDLAASGRKTTDLSQEELERELARRVPNLTAEDLHRLIGYALFKADISRIIKNAPTELIGRETETKLLSDAWDQAVRGEKNRPHVLTFVALGGEGKTSLVAKWAAELAHQEWPGCDAVLAWSFYHQGTDEKTADSSDLFLKEALTVFGDPAMAGSAQHASDKGRRLAQLVGERRALLILDGLEPLQYAPTSPMRGELKDQGLAALLKGLATNNLGLCVVTTRYSIPDLRTYWQTTAPETKLPRLSLAAGVELLRSLGVKGSLRPSDGLERILADGTRRHLNEFETLVEDVQGHALTLNLLGSYLHDAHAGDIRQRDLVKLEEADTEEQGGHAFRVMDAYVWWFESEGDKGKRALALLRLLGLFDRPATADCLASLLKAPAIPDLTEPLVGMTEAQRNIAFTRLESAKLLTVNRDAAPLHLFSFTFPTSLDAHPLLREYFARLLRTQHPEAWREGHGRLYEHLCATTKEGNQPTLEALQPLFQAVVHGCHARLQQEACDKVYFARIERGNEHFASNKLGAWGSELGALACFFESLWSDVSLSLTAVDQAWVLGQSAFRLQALGRLTEALEPMRVTVELFKKQGHWKQAAQGACNLSELELTLGEVTGAVRDAELSVTYADRGGDAFDSMDHRTVHANALNHAGRLADAEVRFRKAEAMQVEREPANPLMYSLSGFRYCDMFLTEAERAAWQSSPHAPREKSRLSHGVDVAKIVAPTTDVDFQSGLPHVEREGYIQACRAVEQRAAKTINVAERNNWLLDIALEHLTLGRAAFYAAILGRAELPLGQNLTDAPQYVPTDQEFATPRRELDAAVDGLRRAGSQDHIPRGLLTRAWLRFVDGRRTGSESAQSDLDEAWEIAERGSMKLFLADVHLYRARLFGRRKGEGGGGNEEAEYPWESPQADLAAAEKLINDCGYHRRDEELAGAKAALLSP